MSSERKVAIVTGGAGGMGSVMSLALARGGLTVAAVDINAEGLDRLAATAAMERLHERVRLFEVDIGDHAACAKLVPRVIAELGGLDVLVNNAGIGMQIVDPDYSVKPPRFWEGQIEGWQRLFDVNVRAPLVLAQGAVQHMIGRKWGRIVNVTTSFDTMLAPKVWAYSAGGRIGRLGRQHQGYRCYRERADPGRSGGHAAAAAEHRSAARQVDPP